MRESAMLFVSLLFSAAVAQGSEPGSVPPAANLNWERSSDYIALRKGDQVIWRFNYGTNEAKPSFYPVALPAGPELTCFRPPDHPWHRSLWFSWKFINGVNYWEEDAKTGESAGKTAWKTPTIETRPDFSARIIMVLTYYPANGLPVLTEHRMIETSPPDQEKGYHIDWTATFTASPGDVLFDRTPLPNEPNGQVFGGYAGLSVRLSPNMQDIRAITSQGPVEFSEARFRGKAMGLDYAGVLENRAVGVAILDHPKNLNSPTPWYAINEKVMHYFSPAVICYQPHTLKAGETMTLRYRVFLHPERWDENRLRLEATRFAEGK